jgi:aspartate/methionine/tyrosine aminotransferase
VPDVEAAKALITPKTRAIVLVTPNNPTGAIYSPATIAAFAALARAHDLALIVDETYRDFLDAGTARAHDLLTEPTWRDHVIQLYSFSKAYAVPGHRLGAIVAGASMLLEIQKVLDTVQICPARAGQTALSWAVEALQPWRLATRQTLNARIAAFSREVSRMNGWSVSSIGAYFAYVRHPFTGASAAEVAERMAVSRGILALPGSYFGPGQDDHLRFAFANADEAAISTLGGRLVGLEV